MSARHQIEILAVKLLDLGGHPKSANDGHLKTGQRELVAKGR